MKNFKVKWDYCILDFLRQEVIKGTIELPNDYFATGNTPEDILEYLEFDLTHCEYMFSPHEAAPIKYRTENFSL